MKRCDRNAELLAHIAGWIVPAMIVLAAIAYSPKARSETLVLSGRAGDYNSSAGCGTPMTWQKPGPGLVVRPDVIGGAFQWWVRWDDVKPDMKIAVSTTAVEGPATCSQITGGLTKAELLGSAPEPVPPTPTPAPTPTTPGEMCLTWAHARFNEDESVLTDLIGYRIRYGTSLADMPGMVDIGSVTAHCVTGLAPGTYYATVTTRSGGGVSKPSNPVTKVVTSAPAPTPTPAPTVTTVETLGRYTLKKGTSNVLTGLADYAACKAAAEARATATATKYFCAVSHSLTVTKK